MVTTTQRRYRRNRLGRFVPNPILGKVRTYPRPGGWAPIHLPDKRGRLVKVPGVYDKLPPSTTQRVAELKHQSLHRGRWLFRLWTRPCYHYGVGSNDEDAMKDSFASYLAAHGDLDRAPDLVVTP